MPGKRVTPVEASAMLYEFCGGMSRNAIAKKFKRSLPTILTLANKNDWEGKRRELQRKLDKRAQEKRAKDLIKIMDRLETLGDNLFDEYMESLRGKDGKKKKSGLKAKGRIDILLKVMDFHLRISGFRFPGDGTNNAQTFLPGGSPLVQSERAVVLASFSDSALEKMRKNLLDNLGLPDEYADLPEGLGLIDVEATEGTPIEIRPGEVTVESHSPTIPAKKNGRGRNGKAKRKRKGKGK